MFERFTEKATKSIFFAQKECKLFSNDSVGTGEILLGLIEEGTGIAFKTLSLFGLSVESVRVELEKQRGKGAGFVDELSLPFTERAKAVLQRSLYEATALGHEFIGTEHMLLALLAEKDGVAYTILNNHSVDCYKMRSHIVRLLGHSIVEEAILASGNTTFHVPEVRKLKIDHAGLDFNTLGASAAPEKNRRLSFERISDASMRIIMEAEKTARRANFDRVDLDCLLSGFLNETLCKATQLMLESGFSPTYLELYLQLNAPMTNKGCLTEITFSIDVEEALQFATDFVEKNHLQSIEPEHILLALLTGNYGASGISISGILSCGGSNIRSLVRGLCQELNIIESDCAFSHVLSSGLVKEKAGRKPKSLEEWFSESSIRVIAGAKERARKRASSLISVEDLAVELGANKEWIPVECRRRIDSFFDSLGGSENEIRLVSPANEVEFSQEILRVFMDARGYAEQLNRSNVRPEHLFLGLLSAKHGFLINPDLDLDELFHSTKRAVLLGDAQLISQMRPKVEPLCVNDRCVLATVRFMATIKDAVRDSKQSNRSVGVPELLLALIEEAHRSEITFVENRSDSIANAKKQIGEMQSVPASGEHELIRILNNSIAHARSLGSDRLDINHLALALLDEENEAVTALLCSLETIKSPKIVVKQRLERCQLMQSHKGHQSEPGEVLDLDRLSIW